MSKQIWKPGNMLYPLPVVMVSCRRPGEKPNIITVAWAGTVCTNPAMLSISVRPERYSHEIIKETGEFVVNLVTEDLTYACDYCGVRSGRDVDKFAEMKLTAIESQVVKAPSIAESPVNIECRVVEIKPLGSHDLFLAKVVSVSADEQYMDASGSFHLNDSKLVTYSHGEYFSLGEKIGSFGYSVKKKPDKKEPEEKKSFYRSNKKESEEKKLFHRNNQEQPEKQRMSDRKRDKERKENRETAKRKYRK